VVPTKAATASHPAFFRKVILFSASIDTLLVSVALKAAPPIDPERTTAAHIGIDQELSISAPLKFLNHRFHWPRGSPLRVPPDAPLGQPRASP
jgi:hypothetical protein